MAVGLGHDLVIATPPGVHGADVAVAAGLHPALGLALEDQHHVVVRQVGDQQLRVQQVLSDAGRAVGRALADLCNNLNPELVVVGGSLGASLCLDEAIRGAIDRYTQPDTAAALRVVPGELGDRAEVVGAVSLAIARVAV